MSSCYLYLRSGLRQMYVKYKATNVSLSKSSEVTFNKLAPIAFCWIANVSWKVIIIITITILFFH